MDKPVISPNFSLEDIRRIRDFNSSRHETMTREEIVTDTRDGAKALLKTLLNRPGRKPITILSGGNKTVFDAPGSKNA